MPMSMSMLSSSIVFLKRVVHVCTYAYIYIHIYEEHFSKTRSPNLGIDIASLIFFVGVYRVLEMSSSHIEVYLLNYMYELYITDYL